METIELINFSLKQKAIGQTVQFTIFGKEQEEVSVGSLDPADVLSGLMTLITNLADPIGPCANKLPV